MSYFPPPPSHRFSPIWNEQKMRTGYCSWKKRWIFLWFIGRKDERNTYSGMWRRYSWIFFYKMEVFGYMIFSIESGCSKYLLFHKQLIFMWALYLVKSEPLYLSLIDRVFNFYRCIVLLCFGHTIYVVYVSLKDIYWHIIWLC